MPEYQLSRRAVGKGHCVSPTQYPVVARIGDENGLRSGTGVYCHCEGLEQRSAIRHVGIRTANRQGRLTYDTGWGQIQFLRPSVVRERRNGRPQYYDIYFHIFTADLKASLAEQTHFLVLLCRDFALYNATLRLESGFIAPPTASLRGQLLEYRPARLGHDAWPGKGHF